MIAWFTRLLFESQPAEFPSSFPVEESVRRLSQATSRSLFAMRREQAAVGRVSESKVSLQRVIPLVRNSFKPYFFGSFRNVNGRVVLVGRFTMHPFTKVFQVLWFGFCVLWTIAATVALVRDPEHVDPRWLPLVGVGMIVFGVLLTWFGRYLSRNDVSWLSSVIRNALTVSR